MTVLSASKAAGKFPDDSPAEYAKFAAAVTQIQCNRDDPAALKAALAGREFQGG